jgi:hypothetical protein
MLAGQRVQLITSRAALGATSGALSTGDMKDQLSQRLALIRIEAIKLAPCIAAKH